MTHWPSLVALRFRSRLHDWQEVVFGLRHLLPRQLRQTLGRPFHRSRRWVLHRRVASALGAMAKGVPAAGYSVICFPIVDWGLRVQRPQQLLARLARAGHRVFYLRTDFEPANAAPRLEARVPNLWEVGLPGPPRPLSIFDMQVTPSQVDTWLEAMDVLRRSERLDQVVCLVHLPLWGALALAARDRWGWKVVYDCLDEHAGFATSTPTARAEELTLIAQSDLVLTTARALYDKCAPVARRCEMLPNAADFDHFHRSLRRSRAHPQPVIGYYGMLGHWFEAEWVDAAARAHPAWQFVLIGDSWGIDLHALDELSNVHLLGARPYAALPDYLHGFDVAIIPFKLNALTRAVDPVKFYEYLSAGKPVVAVDLPELQPHRELFYPAATGDEFVRQLEAAVVERDPDRVAARIAMARVNTWEVRVAVLDEQLRRLFEPISND